VKPTTADDGNPSAKEPLSEKVMDSIQGKDEPMEVSHPEAPPLLVFASYPIVLLLGIIVAFVVFWMNRG
jgi:hypothetical protein